jgi:hypothetical protein
MKGFSSLAFMKSKVYNKFTIHLQIVVRMFAQQFYSLENFPYAKLLSSGKQNEITIAMMVRVQLFCGVINNVSTIANFFVVLSSCVLCFM